MNSPVIIGNATLYLGDCREILPTLPKVDAVITDPPYGIGENSYRVANRGKLAKAIDYGNFDWDTEPASADLIDACLTAGKMAIIFGGNYFQLPPSRCWLVWDKQNGGNDFADCELAWTNITGSVRIFRHMWNGMLRASERNTQRVHPTQKPVALMKWCIERANNPRSIIDPFMGSGTTGIASMDMGCSFIGIEKDERYFEIACRRIENAQRQQPLFPSPRDDYEEVDLWDKEHSRL